MWFDVKVEARPALNTLEGIIQRAGDPSGIFDRIFRHLEASERRRWQTHGFGRWANEEDGHPATMFQSGDLFASLTGRSRFSIRTVRRDYLVFGTRVYYAQFHQKGKGGVPKRTIVGATKDDRNFAVAALRDFIITGHR